MSSPLKTAPELGHKISGQKVSSKKTPKRLRVSIRHDAIAAADYLKYKLPYACEDCTHFNASTALCTLGYTSHHHQRETQKKSFELSGKMALCRFLEID